MPYIFNPFTGNFDNTVPLSGGKVPAEYLPSYVDDVVEYASLAAFPATGETGKIYLALDANTIYRWSGSQYVLIGSEAPVVSVNGETGAVSLNVDDLDNYNLRLLPDATSGRWNTRIYGGAPATGQFRVISTNRVFIDYFDSLGNDLTSNFTSVFSNYSAIVPVWLSADGITWSQLNSQYNSLNSNDTFLDLQITSPFTFGNTLFFATVDPTGGPATYPLANKNLLSYNNTTTKWEPTPIDLTYISDVDVITTAPTDGQALVWDQTASKWEPGSVATAAQGALADTALQPTSSIDALADVDTSTTAPSVGQALIWDGTNFVPDTQTLSQQTLTYQTASLAAGASEDFTINAGSVFNLLEITTSPYSWIRVYDSSAARSADTRTSPGAPFPAAGTGFYAEIATASLQETIKLAPVPTCQGTNGLAYVRLVNIGASTASYSSTFSFITIAA